MRFGLKTVLATLVVFGSANLGRAEVYTMYTAGTPALYGTVTSNPSTLGLNINLAGLVTAMITPVNYLPNGTAIVDMNLDATNSGTMYINSTNITLANFMQNVSLGFLGSVVATGNGIGVGVTAGPVTVTNGAFTITSATPGTLAINSGSIALVGTVLGNAVNATINFNTDPVSLDFSGLGGITIPGTADADGSGFDMDAPPPGTLAHLGYNIAGGVPNAGLTGFSNIDTDGAEVNLNYNSVSIATTIISGTLTLPTTISLVGGISVSVPEVGTLALGGIAAIGMGVVAVRRRRAA